MKYDIGEINGKYVKVPYEKRYDVADYNNATYVRTQDFITNKTLMIDDK